MIPFIDAIMPVVGKLLDFIPDPQKKAEAKQKMIEELNRNSEEILKSLSAVDIAQTQVNLEEAKSTDKYVARARPTVMWICAFGLAWETIIKLFIGTICVVSKHAEMVAQLPNVNGEVLMTMLGYMLGYGGMRTWEKTKGVQS